MRQPRRPLKGRARPAVPGGPCPFHDRGLHADRYPADDAGPAARADGARLPGGRDRHAPPHPEAGEAVPGYFIWSPSSS
jgi:hypothetical protein